MKVLTNFEILSKKVLTELSGGASQSLRCKLAIATCAHDIALAGLATSNPDSSCAYMRRVCGKK